MKIITTYMLQNKNIQLQVGRTQTQDAFAIKKMPVFVSMGCQR